MSNPISPVGFYVLIEIPKVEEVSEGGIIMPADLTKKERVSIQTGTIREFGPTAYVDWAGCKQDGKTPPECWGLKIGDVVEFRKFEGMSSSIDDSFRYIPDSHIVGVVK